VNPGSDAPPSVARVVPNVTGIDKSFDYLVPECLRDQVRVGTVVRIPLAGRRVGGWVTALGPSDGTVAPDRLKAIAKVSGAGPAPDVVDLARWAAHRWVGRVRPILVSASPPRALLAVPAARHGNPVLDVAVDGVETLVAAGGGVLRRPPTSDPLPVLLHALRRGPVFAVLPSVAGAQLLAARLRTTGCTVALLPRDWGAAAGGVDVVLGARAGVWGPITGCRTIVVFDEHDEALQEERNPTWHARDVAIERARRLEIPCLLVSPAPSLVALEWAGSRLRLPSRLEERAGWPVVDIVDRGDQEPWVTSLVGSRLITALRDCDRRVVCVLNRPGRARRLACRSCRELTVCEHCASAVGQAPDGTLHCERCGTVRPAVCQACGSSAFALLRPGVTRLREELEAAAGRPVVEVTGALDDSEPLPPADVYVGTEAVLHRVHDADVVAFLDIDAELLAPRFRAAEQAMALLVRAALLVGPRAGGGRLLVQTRLPHHEVLDAALYADPGRLVAPERSRRRALEFPPFSALATVTGAGAAPYAEALRAETGLSVVGSAERLLVRAATWDALADGLAAVPRPAGSRLRIAVDPPRI
jgi:primosomal protein N' (replication factor Y) (superfamily II helicase)